MAAADRARWRCQACGLPMYRREVHQQRAQRGSDFDRDGLIALWGAWVATAPGPMDGSQVA